MENLTKQILDSNILTLISENNLKGWEQLYDKYSSVIYGAICSLISEKNLAEEIFIKLFCRLKEERILLKINFSLCVCLLRYTYYYTRQELKIRGINATESRIGANSVVQSFYSQSIISNKGVKQIQNLDA